MIRRKGTLFLLLTLLISTAQAQVIFSYGPKSVSKEEFLKAYNKNNTEEKATDKAYREYLDLYIRFKIKVQAALDLKLDTLPGQQAELRAFRSQVVESYLKDEESISALIDEAMKKALDRINAAHAQLKKVMDFGKVAAEYSEDPAAKKNNGDLGYITVFSLPYDMETTAYTLAAGKYSAPFRTRNGYHIFKKIDERKAVGTLRASQILLAFLPDVTEAQKQQQRKLADSIYRALQQGADFHNMVHQYSGDAISLQSEGEMPSFGVGRYDAAFEAAAFGLAKDGEISRPVLTEFGYHIIKRLQRVPVKS